MDLIKELRNPNTIYGYRAVMDAAAEEIERCHARLEIDHVFWMDADGDELVRKEIPYNERLDMPDGIACRDTTISLLESDGEHSE